MEKKSIVIIQDNEKRNMELQKIIAATSDLEVVGIATDGIGGYKLIEEKKPDNSSNTTIAISNGTVLPGAASSKWPASSGMINRIPPEKYICLLLYYKYGGNV